MIKINLLPVKEKKRRQQILIGVYVSLVLLLIAAVLGWILTMRYQKKDALTAEIAKIEEESAQYQDKIREIKELEASQARLNDYRKIAKGIGDEQRKLLGSLDQTASILPPEIWFTDIQQGRDKDANLLTLRGYSLSQSMLAALIRDMGRPAGFLTNPAITINSISSKQGDNTVYQFEIKTTMAAAK